MIYNVIFRIAILLLTCNFAYADELTTGKPNCFLVKESNMIIQQQGDCKLRYAPCSTFKIVLSLIGFDAGILKDETHPQWPFKKDYPIFLDSWKQATNPTSWMKNSCVWYSQVLTKKLGLAKFADYVSKFNYGNQDISGDKGRNNGLTNSWLSSSLAISPQEQVVFLQKLIDNRSPVSRHAQKMTKNLLYLEELPRGWKLYGKTGSGTLLSSDQTTKLDIKHGWFIGWIQKSERSIVFVNHIIDAKKQDAQAGPRAKAEAMIKLQYLIDKLEGL